MNKDKINEYIEDLLTVACCPGHDYSCKEVYKYVKQLQSNWDSLREIIETDNKREKGYIERIRSSDLCHGDYPVEYFYAEKRKEITDYYLDKMNELEIMPDYKKYLR